MYCAPYVIYLALVTSKSDWFQSKICRAFQGAFLRFPEWILYTGGFKDAVAKIFPLTYYHLFKSNPASLESDIVIEGSTVLAEQIWVELAKTKAIRGQPKIIYEQHEHL